MGFRKRFWQAKYLFDRALENSYLRALIETIIISLSIALWDWVVKDMTSLGVVMLCLAASLTVVLCVSGYFMFRREGDIGGNFRSGTHLQVNKGQAGPMNIQIAAYPHEITQNPIKERVVRISDVLDGNGNISSREFKHCTLIGPATIYLVGNVIKYEWPFHHCTWEEGAWNCIVPNTTEKPSGCIESFETDYIHCHFRNVVFMAKPEHIESNKEKFAAGLRKQLEVITPSTPSTSPEPPHTGLPER